MNNIPNPKASLEPLVQMYITNFTPKLAYFSFHTVSFYFFKTFMNIELTYWVVFFFFL